ncbi:hypothetical protein P3T76_001559 [Phytophthora citrophthora]|uniref:Uncharacterized protein n=1 Tax=Phytophthora citrophthora TaxID=4793 RepID=A0AAD9GYR3_9STRA|nr:hypothetical protein P3T76_001559 [Phytophthora citrophthora]
MPVEASSFRLGDLHLISARDLSPRQQVGVVGERTREDHGSLGRTMVSTAVVDTESRDQLVDGTGAALACEDHHILPFLCTDGVGNDVTGLFTERRRLQPCDGWVLPYVGMTWSWMNFSMHSRGFPLAV